MNTIHHSKAVAAFENQILKVKTPKKKVKLISVPAVVYLDFADTGGLNFYF